MSKLLSYILSLTAPEVLCHATWHASCMCITTRATPQTGKPEGRSHVIISTLFIVLHALSFIQLLGFEVAACGFQPVFAVGFDLDSPFPPEHCRKYRLFAERYLQPSIGLVDH